MSLAKTRILAEMMLTHMFRFLFLLFLFFPFAARAEDIKKIQPTGYVTDLAGVLTSQAKTQLEALCLELEQKTGAQMAIVTVHSLGAEEAQVYANKLFKQLGIGSKKDDRGVLLLVAPDEHHYWTEVGYGLEPVINDARAGDAGRTMVPYFKQGDYSAGVQAGAWQLAKYVADDRNVTLSGQPAVRPARARDNPGDSSSPLPWIFLAILVIVIINAMARAGNMRGGGRGSGCLWFLLGMLANSSGGRSSGSGWGGGGWGGGGFGGGGGGFGGFGGGSSGGGGAGGSW